LPQNFRQRLKDGVILFDGAMGTMLYEKGAYINQCYESLNLSAGAMVKDIHAEYIRAGADMIETNTFGANGYKLRPFGMESNVAAVNTAAVKLAREAAAGTEVAVAGAVGPLGAYLKPRGPLTIGEAEAFYREQIQALISAGVDAIVFETFSDIQELKLAVDQARALSKDLPIIAQASFNERCETELGTKAEAFICDASGWDVDVIGFNCSTGPADMLNLLEHAAKLTSLPLSVQPNAGMPRLIEGRYFYLASPEYMAEYAKRFIQTGATVVGGCCGTTPKHIKAMRSAIHALFPRQRAANVCITEPGQAKPEMRLEEKSKLAGKLARREFITSVEITPPRSADARPVLEKCRMLKARGVDAVNIPDGPRASARLAPMVLAILIEREIGMETVLHYTCRDRNIIGMQSDLLGIQAAGLRNLLIITGDPPKMGDYPDATAVFDVDSIGLTRIITGLNQGLDVGGNPIPQPLTLLKGVGVNPGAINLDKELERLRQKIDAGAEYAITQPVFDPEIFMRFRDRLRDLPIPLIAGVWPLVSFKNAEFMNNEVPGASVPLAILERMRLKGSGPDAQREGVLIAGEALHAIRPMIDGVQVAAALGKVELALEVLQAGKVLAGENC
jgi:homocysteine S-methyltransferase